MAYGGGSFTAQDKVLPGAYINFISRTNSKQNIAQRGIVACPLTLSWGEEGKIFEVTAEDFEKNSIKLFGYEYTADNAAMRALREVFTHAKTVLCYRLGTGVTAQNTKYGKAKYPGAFGNQIKVSVAANVDDTSAFDISTYFGSGLVDTQTVKNISELKANDYVIWNSTGTLAADAGSPFTQGADGEITGTHYQNFLNAIESYYFNVLCCPVRKTSDSDTQSAATIKLFEKFAKRMRDELGKKIQLCAYEPSGDYEGVVGVWNNAFTKDGTASNELVYWVSGALAAADVNESLTNTEYDGELAINTDYTLSELEKAISDGKFMLHNDNGAVKVLKDINSLVTYTQTKGEVFSDNQTVRIIDRIAVDTSALFNGQYHGKVPNNESGRESLWNGLVKLMKELQSVGAIENFDEKTVKTSAGEKKRAVTVDFDGIQPVNTMDQLYMRVMIV